MFRKICLIFLYFTVVQSYMAREYYEYKGQKGQVHRIPYRTLLLDWKEYIQKITRDYLTEIEEYGLCNLNLDDYSQNISRIFFGNVVNGIVNYTNGFIGTLQRVQIQDNQEMSWIDETTMLSYMRSKFIFDDIMLYFDYYAELEGENSFGGTVGIPLESLEFEIKVIKNYNTSEVDGIINDASAKIKKNSRWYYEPSNKFTDIFSRDIKWSFFDDLQKLTNTTMKDLLNNVIKRNPYPDICFSCNEGMKLHEYDHKLK